MIRIRDNYDVHSFSGINVVVDKSEEPYKALFSLNETGAFIWKHLKGEITLDVLVDRLQEEYDVDAGQAKEDIEEFLRDIAKKGVMEE